MPQPSKPLLLLGGLSPQQFMRTYWQKKPLLIRAAWNQPSILSRAALFELAKREDVESRLVTQSAEGWQLEYGPFKKLPSLRATNWTVLVQGVNYYESQMAQLLQQFSFLPSARLDDVMVSYATPGGGVGPHFDSYDVFLLQLHGRREWQIATQSDLALVPNLPLKILRNFEAQQTWVLEPGDMLYLPPHIAHHGVALDPCLTASIGFRAPSYAELTEAFFAQLTENLFEQPEFSARYTDPGQSAVTCPGKIPDLMVKQVAQQLRKVRWQPEHVQYFLGCYLSEPKPNIFFEAPDKLPNRTRLRKVLSDSGLVLDRRSQALYDAAHFYLNGEAFALQDSQYAADLLPKLADQRILLPSEMKRLIADQPLFNQVCQWLSYGWLLPNNE